MSNDECLMNVLVTVKMYIFSGVNWKLEMASGLVMTVTNVGRVIRRNASKTRENGLNNHFNLFYFNKKECLYIFLQMHTQGIRMYDAFFCSVHIPQKGYNRQKELRRRPIYNRDTNILYDGCVLYITVLTLTESDSVNSTCDYLSM